LERFRRESSIEKYMLELITATKNLKPVMFYLNQPDIAEHLRRLADERVNEKEEKDWLQQVILYTENSPYGQTHKLKGFEGVVKGFEKRKQIELGLIKKLPITTYIMENQDYNWDDIWQRIREKLDIELKS
jgi:hypothetical protein